MAAPTPGLQAAFRMDGCGMRKRHFDSRIEAPCPIPRLACAALALLVSIPLSAEVQQHGPVLGFPSGIQSGAGRINLSALGNTLASQTLSAAGWRQVPDTFVSEANPSDIAVTSSTSLGEGGSSQVAVSLLYDDDTASILAEDGFSLSTLDDAISTVGSTVTAGAVYRDEIRQVGIDARGLTRQVNFDVTDVDRDNFGPFADDGLPDDWEVGFFGPDGNNFNGLASDDDGDGLTALVEFGLGGDPTLPDFLEDRLPSLFLADFNGEGYLHFQFNRRLASSNPTGLVYEVETSDNLSSWFPLNNEIDAQPSIAGFELVTMRDTLSVASGNRRFIRLNLATAP